MGDQTEEASTARFAGNKFVFLEFFKEDCGNCKRMEALLYPAFDFEALLVSMVPVKIDPDTPLGREFVQRYGIDATPAILVTTPEGRRVFLMAGFYNQADFFRHATTALDSYRAFARRIDSQDISKLPAKDALDTGSELYRRSDPEAALPRLRRAASATGATNDAQREDALELLAAVELDLEQPASSRQTIERLLKTTKDRARRERAEIFRAQIPSPRTGRPRRSRSSGSSRRTIPLSAHPARQRARSAAGGARRDSMKLMGRRSAPRQ